MGAVGSCVSFVLFFFSCVTLAAPLWASVKAGPLYIGGVYKPASPLMGDAAISDAFGGKIEVSPLSRYGCGDLLGNCGGSSKTPHFDGHSRLSSSGDYTRSVEGAALIAGYDAGGSRLEFELQSERFDIRRGLFVPEKGDKFRYSLARRVGARPDIERREGVISLRNDGVKLVSATMSLCRDIDVGFGAIPYVCGGFGLERASTFGSTAFGVTCQARGGVSYRINKRLSGFVGLFYRRFGVNGDGEFSVPLSSSNIHIMPRGKSGVNERSARPGVGEMKKSELARYGLFIDPVVRLGIAYYGAELGLRFSLDS